MLQGRAMDQSSPSQRQVLVVSGRANDAAGYATAAGLTTTRELMPFAESLARPVIHDPNAPTVKQKPNSGLHTLCLSLDCARSGEIIIIM